MSIIAGAKILNKSYYSKNRAQSKVCRYGTAMQSDARLLIPIRSAKLCGALKHEKHRGGLPCGWGREAPKEHWRIT